MRWRLMTIVLALIATCAAQTAMQTEMHVTASGDRGTASPTDKRPKPTPEQLERGRQLLESVEAQAAGLDGGMRAYGLLQVAHMYAPSDKKKAARLLQDALAATSAVDDDKLDTRLMLQRRILQEMVPLAPDKVDELLSQVDPKARATALNALLSYYQEKKELDHAIEVLYRISQEDEMPYGSALRIVQALPQERSADVQHIFMAALNSFQNHKHSGACVGDCDFAALVVRLWNRLPPSAVLDAIHAMLKEARERGDSGSISMASENGAVAFNSFYEWRLFQLIPVLKRLDESEAKKLLQEYQQVQTLLAKYPEGTNSLQPPDTGSGENRRRASTSFAFNNSGRPGSRGGPGPGMPTPLELQQVAKIMADAEKHPRDALAATAAISRPSLRSQALLRIARLTWKNDSSVAREALSKFMDLAPQLDLDQRVLLLGSVAGIYFDMGEIDDARSVIEKGLAAAGKVYESDSNADDPNKALKAYWPSTEAYRSMLRLAARVSMPWATSLVKEISDPEIRVMAQIALAGWLLDVPAGSTTIMSSTRKGTNMSTGLER